MKRKRTKEREEKYMISRRKNEGEKYDKRKKKRMTGNDRMKEKVKERIKEGEKYKEEKMK